VTAPFGTVGPNPDLLERRFRQLQAQIDALGQRGGKLLVGDPAGGIATPWVPIPLAAKFAVASGLYTSMNRNVDTTERTLWEGSIGYLSHPRIQVTGYWGVASGTNNTEYKLKVGSNTIGTWTSNTAAAKTTQGPFDPLTNAAIGDTNVPIELTAKTLSGTGSYACQVLSCYLRQT
jgi:hypothetical protein